MKTLGCFLHNGVIKHQFLTLFTSRWRPDTTAVDVPHSSVCVCVCVGLLTPASPSAPTTASASRQSPAPHRRSPTSSQATGARPRAPRSPTPPPAEGGLPWTASAPPAAPRKEAASGRSGSRTSSCCLRLGRRIRASSECGWTAG